MMSLICLLLPILLITGYAYADCRKMFSTFDKDHSHSLSKAEFEHIFLEFDSFPADKTITRNEFIDGWHKSGCAFQSDNDALLFFLESDLDRNFVVSVSDIDRRFAFFDHDHNGSLSSKEFESGWDKIYGEGSHSNGDDD